MISRSVTVSPMIPVLSCFHALFHCFFMFFTWFKKCNVLISLTITWFHVFGSILSREKQNRKEKVIEKKLYIVWIKTMKTM